MAEPSASDLFPGLPIWAQLVIAFFIVCMSAFFAGSTLGLLSLDKVGLDIVLTKRAVRGQMLTLKL